MVTTTDTDALTEALARAWERGAQAMDTYHQKRNHFMTWEGMHRGEPERPTNPYERTPDDRR